MPARCGAIVPAAGSSRRMGAVDKLFVRLWGKPSLQWVLECLAAEPVIAQVVVATSPDNLARVQTLVAALGASRITVCLGGETRQASVRAALDRLDPALDLVLIHDAARPLLTARLIHDGIAAGERGAAVAAVPVSDTIKRVDAGGMVRETLPRAELVAVQTPQVFRRDWLLSAYERCGERAVTDEAGLLEAAGFPVATYPGDPENLKLTRPADLQVAAVFLAARGEQEQAG